MTRTARLLDLQQILRRHQGDAGLVAAGRDVLAKINAMIPPALSRELEATTRFGPLPLAISTKPR